jgi:hypothetical protein
VPSHPSGTHLTPEASELVVGSDLGFACETYIFEPAPAEVDLGHLYAVGETEDRGGIGKELLDLTVQALQREYYRAPQRGMLASFESALHQANLVLHDTAEQGIRDWMGHFHVAVAVLAGPTLHISTAGLGNIWLARRSQTTSISQDLSHSPITNPLRTFAQVASGTVATRDILYLGTAELPQIFRPEDLSRFAIEHSSAHITTRLQQLYADQGSRAPLAALVISLLPTHIAAESLNPEAGPLVPRRRRDMATVPAPRRPLVIQRSSLRTLLFLMSRFVVSAFRLLGTHLWPLILKGSRQGGRVVAQASLATTKNVQALTQRGWQTLPTSGQRVEAVRSRLSVTGMRQWLARLPRTSKIFAVVAVVLAVALMSSLGLLQRKRATDTQIQQASETLQEARTKQAAVETALIYDNRDQAQTLLGEAQEDLAQLRSTGLYTAEADALAGELSALHDRLQRVARVKDEALQSIGDFATALPDAELATLLFLDNTLYTVDPATNRIAGLPLGGSASIVSEKTEGIGFVTDAVAHPADKNIIFATNTPGLALFDTKTITLRAQDSSLASDAKPSALAVYSNRLYLFDQTAGTILTFSKSLRGYSGGTHWITDTDFDKQTIRDFAIDGSVYTLHTDGSLHKLFKGEEVDFPVTKLEPALNEATRLLASEEWTYLYVVDPAHKRVVRLTKEGVLERQILLDNLQNMRDVAVGPDEKVLYVLDGTRVVGVSLE